MMNPAEELIDAIHKAAELEFWRRPDSIQTSRVPLIIWRYAQKPESVPLVNTITSLLLEALSNRRVPWELREPGRNWVLAPQQFFQIEDSGRFRLFPEILNFLEETDPDLGSKTNQDLREISQCLVNALAQLRNDVRH
jgi:hypothetical protein